MRRLFMLTALLAFFAVTQTVSAQTTTAPTSTLDRIRQTGTIRLGYRPDDAPFAFIGSNSAQPIGFMIAICSDVAAQLPQLANIPAVKVTWVPVTSVNRFDAVRNGTIDLLCDSTTMTIPRRKVVDFSIPTFVDGAGLLMHGKQVTTIAGLAGQKIGVLAGSTTEQALHNTLTQEKMFATVVTAQTYTDGLKMLDAGTINAFFGDHSVLMYLIPQSKAPDQLAIADNFLTVEPYALALRHGDEDFRLVVDQALSRTYRSGRVAAMFSAIFGRPITPSILQFYTFASFPE
ncbi:MAG TPA: amino acid ABC transporter substrate-binding protein [Candidatus Lustribacter sp.]|jgi:ABC-type amino acid transport substrate-binding protein|nr:amino acid ABC transporter substrate-binding protein [Candidatus Lustribacter sp.]